MMISDVEKTVERYEMIPHGARVVAALSGGSDSMAMINALMMLREKYCFTIEAAHVNHGIRGESANRDERFVERWCKENEIRLHVLHADVPQAAKQSGESIEQCGRRIRYEFFASLGSDAIIATAHTLSDRVETFIFNVTRGSALKGLCSIPAKRNNIIRPLFDCTKEQIIEFCRVNSIPYIEDETNEDINYSRNRIRHTVIPQLKKINPAVEHCVGRCTQMLREDEVFLSSLAREAVSNAKIENGYDAKNIFANPRPVRTRAIALAVHDKFNIIPESSCIERIESILENGGSCQINGGYTVRVRKGILDFPEPMNRVVDEIDFDLSGTFFAGIMLFGEIIEFDETIYSQILSKSYSDYYVDYDKIIGKMKVRSRRSGDRITMISRKCTKTLKKLYNELSVPPEKRDTLFIIADDKGLIVSQAAGCDARCIVTEKTKRILKITAKIQ